MNKATLIKHLDNFSGIAAIYKVSPPMRDFDGNEWEYVIVSATTLPFTGCTETYIFPAHGANAITPADWGEMPGSLKNTLSHSDALSNAGYQIAIA